MKKILLTGIVLAMAIGLCACGGENTAETDIPSPSAEAVTATATPSPAATQAATQDAASESVKTGVLLEASAHHLVIEAPDGSTYSFITDDNTEMDGKGENLGDTVSVEYSGDYTADMTAAKITIDQKADESVSATATEVTTDTTDTSSTKKSVSATSKSASGKSTTIKYITGVVEDSSMNNITVEWNGGEYTFLKDDNTSVEGNVTVGSTVRIYHEGDLADGITAIDISVVDADFADQDMKYITGTVVDASMNSIIIENGGHQYSVLKDDNTKSDSIQPGDTVRVFHKGGLADGMVASSIIKQ